MSTHPSSSDKKPTYQRDDVVRIINSVIQRADGTKAGAQELIAHELRELKKIIDEARQELSTSQPHEIGNVHIPEATDELDAVVAATEEATGTIMDSCETIENEIDGKSDDSSTKIGDAVTKIYEACSFQDITGQRITKVVTTLKQIEQKTSKLLQIIGDSVPSSSSGSGEKQPAAASMTDEDLLNGPQLPGQGVSQEEIDRLLSEFD